MGNSCNHEHKEEIEEDIILVLFAARGGEDLAKIYFRAGICHHSDFFISGIQRLFSSTRLNCLEHKLICRTQISNGADRLDPNTTRIKITLIWIVYFY